MISVSSKLEHVKEKFDQVNDFLEQHEFTLGGNWEYDHGYFDRHLDEERKVWLRIPFQVSHGRVDGDAGSTDAVIELGKPFVLKHLYQEGLDGEAAPNVYGSLVNQFQEPVDKNAKVETKWVREAEGILQKLEQSYLH